MPPDIRIGIGYDAHRFGGDGPVVLAGVTLDHPTGVVATSDGDVVVHAICDALLGAAAIGDLGTFFPSSDPQWAGADSLDLLRSCRNKIEDRGYSLGNVDVTIIVQNIIIAPHRQAMREKIAGALGIGVNNVSVKATTTDGLGWIGGDEGLAAQAVASVYR